MPRSSRTRMVWSPSAVSVASMTSSYGTSSSLVSTRRCRGGSHASTRPVPSQPLAKNRARNSPPRRRSPSKSPSQRPRRRGSVRADHRSSLSVSKRSSMRTMPLPSADRRLPRMRPLPRALLVIWSSFARVLPGRLSVQWLPGWLPARTDTILLAADVRPAAQLVKPFQRPVHALHPDIAVVDVHALVFRHPGAVEDLSHDGRVRAIGNQLKRPPLAPASRALGPWFGVRVPRPRFWLPADVPAGLVLHDVIDH